MSVFDIKEKSYLFYFEVEVFVIKTNSFVWLNYFSSQFALLLPI